MSIPCKGNGMTLGLTDGKNDYGLSKSSSTVLSWAPLIANNKTYGTDVGNTQDALSENKAISFGITTDPTKSGVVADISDGQIVVIKY